MSEIPQGLVDRMIVLMRNFAQGSERTIPEATSLLRDCAKCILAELPKPVDPDLIEARAFVAGTPHPFGDAGWPLTVLSGTVDDGTLMQIALAAIKRGRELERGS